MKLYECYGWRSSEDPGDAWFWVRPCTVLWVDHEGNEFGIMTKDTHSTTGMYVDSEWGTYQYDAESTIARWLQFIKEWL